MDFEIAAAAVVVSGVYLKWAVAPLLLAFELGRLFERMIRNRGQASARRRVSLRAR